MGHNAFLVNITLFLQNKFSVLLTMALCCLLSTKLFAADTLHLAVASNFISPIKQLAQDYEEETGQKIQLSFGSSGKLFAQIQHGAPYDIFLSADVAKPQALIQSQFALADSIVTYAKGQLALWSVTPLGSDIKISLQNSNRIAIANPKLAPYGKAAQESLQALSLWNTVEQKLVQGENIGQTYQFVYSQNADIGFVAYSQVLAGKVKGNTIKIPSELHSDINQAGVILSHSKNVELSRAFMAFLMRPDTQAKITQFGYAAPNS
ncbi:molybdate transport system substrate-binding protein [Marinomonas alcarazii]|uniref:Molybdate transport system substrate-binding protein n=1 Tax=Marinomonas alcarazii TaxID=491949 RepID=A0A318UQ04_9GAMM|nr:molybdate ABC transporter substrate-binding protein [Marinomonas alcarazii]PYF78596.1 molybdate transport system substrate-binding protein [Marinomonas alcarazii]